MPNRVELHVHLDGSVSPATLLRISQSRALRLPGINRVPSTIADIWTALRSMGEIWKWFDLVNMIIGGNETALRQIAEDFVARQASFGINYTEVRWDPIRPSHSVLANNTPPLSYERTIAAVAAGLKAGSERHGVEVHQLLCAMRNTTRDKCFELARLAERTRSGEMGGVVGMDLAGDEFHWNNSKNDVEACFRYAKEELQLNTTVHAGEMADDEYNDVRTAVEVMLVDRVGHGYAATQDEGVLNMLVRSGVHVESCPAGRHDNLQATGVYRRRGVNFGISTDDPAEYFGNVSLVEVEALIRSQLGFNDADIAQAHSRAFKARFAPDAARIAAARRSGAAAGSRSVQLVELTLVLVLVVGVFFFCVCYWARRFVRRRRPSKAGATEITLTVPGVVEASE